MPFRRSVGHDVSGAHSEVALASSFGINVIKKYQYSSFDQIWGRFGSENQQIRPWLEFWALTLTVPNAFLCKVTPLLGSTP